ncbi:RNA polymerase sigma factor SigA2 [Porphyridium purpureum]|uniref:RNA polymerase sigma factor SigA2 n=1 Tax=Porphyridium purpureum TaxID=35688 RepID=A0A5J4Z916_PORPP|nr:RNA polymerase sigma factor SigA2 [Porphyridium purpureum]|eukprot:POR1901..scf295_1
MLFVSAGGDALVPQARRNVELARHGNGRSRAVCVRSGRARARLDAQMRHAETGRADDRRDQDGAAGGEQREEGWIVPPGLSPHAVIKGVAQSCASKLTKQSNPVKTAGAKSVRTQRRPAVGADSRRRRSVVRAMSRYPPVRSALAPVADNREHFGTATGKGTAALEPPIIRGDARSGQAHEMCNLENVAEPRGAGRAASCAQHMHAPTLPTSEYQNSVSGPQGAALDTVINSALQEFRRSQSSLTRRRRSWTHQSGSAISRDSISAVLDLADASGGLLSNDEERMLGEKVSRLRKWEAAREKVDLQDALGQPYQSQDDAFWQAWMSAAGFQGTMDRFRAELEDMRRARCKLVERNLRLVLWVIRKYEARVSKSLYIDLFQEGVSGLLVAASKFDWSLNYRFATYAVWYIRQRVQTSTVLQTATYNAPFRLPHYLYCMMDKVRFYVDGQKRLHGQAPTIADIAAHFDVNEKHVELLLSRLRPGLSLTVDNKDPLSGRTQAFLLGIEDENLSPEECYFREELKFTVMKFMRNLLSEPEMDVVNRSYRLAEFGSHPTQTESKIAESLGISQPEVRKRKRAGLRIMRKNKQILAEDWQQAAKEL